LRLVPGALRLALLTLAPDSASHRPDTDLAVAIIELRRPGGIFAPRLLVAIFGGCSCLHGETCTSLYVRFPTP
jgi:hypothetical protein